MSNLRTSPLERLLDHVAESDRLAVPLLAQAQTHRNAALADIFLAANGLTSEDVEPADGEADYDGVTNDAAICGNTSVPAGRGHTR